LQEGGAIETNIKAIEPKLAWRLEAIRLQENSAVGGAGAASAAWTPTVLCEPSQNGLLFDAPQRQSQGCRKRADPSCPSPLISTTPSKCNGPFACAVTTASPAPSPDGPDGASDVARLVSIGPEARNSMSRCAPSQKGLFADRPQRHSAAFGFATPSSAPAVRTRSGLRTSSGPSPPQ